MISRLFEQQKLSKSQRKKFVPFVNERDFMGTLIHEKVKSPSDRTAKSNLSNNLAIIQNLKKTTKEYFFDKKYSKLKEKLKRMEQSLHPKEHNYDAEVDQCIRTIQHNSALISKKHDDNQYYVDLNEQLSEKINFIKTDILGRIGTSKSEKKRKNKLEMTNLSEQFQQKQLRITRHVTQEKENIDRQSNKKISKEIFASIGNRSEYMTDFTNAGLKYRSFVQTRRLNPWKKWYAEEELQLFPGEKIKMKRLKKTIY